MSRWQAIIAGTILLAGCSQEDLPPLPVVDRDGQVCKRTEPLIRSPQVIRELWHDPAAFTQSLTFDEHGRLYESRGGYGNSSVAELDPESGRTIRAVPLPDDKFGEGLTSTRDCLTQLTWKSGSVYRWHEDLTAAGSEEIDGEGWGLVGLPNGGFIRSDGTSTLHFHDRNLRETTDLVVQATESTQTDQLNELELGHDARRLWANQWRTDRIV